MTSIGTEIWCWICLKTEVDAETVLLPIMEDEQVKDKKVKVIIALILLLIIVVVIAVIAMKVISGLYGVYTALCTVGALIIGVAIGIAIGFIIGYFKGKKHVE